MQEGTTWFLSCNCSTIGLDNRYSGRIYSYFDVIEDFGSSYHICIYNVCGDLNVECVVAKSVLERLYDGVCY